MERVPPSVTGSPPAWTGSAKTIRFRTPSVLRRR